MTTFRLRVDSKAFGAARPILENIDLTLHRREIVALLGPSGCGKTTLLRIVAGLDHDFAGTLEWGFTAPRIGMVFQQPLLLPWRSVRQNLRLVLHDEALMPGADAILRTLGVWEARDMYPAGLSLGMARRVSLARALAITPGLLLLDEPFVSLDPDSARRARDIVLGAWRSWSMSIILVTHDTNEAASLADRVFILAPGPGRIVEEVVIADGDRRDGSVENAAATIRTALERVSRRTTV